MLKQTRFWSIPAVLGAALLAASAVPQLGAAGFNDDMTKVTFSGPVEIGNIALGAGTYVFKTMSGNADRNIVEVMDQDNMHLLALVNAIPISAPEIPDQTRIELKEGPANTPESVHAWFYPGETTGWEFPAPKTK
jgi:hypothetical protein